MMAISVMNGSDNPRAEHRPWRIGAAQISISLSPSSSRPRAAAWMNRSLPVDTCGGGIRGAVRAIPQYHIGGRILRRAGFPCRRPDSAWVGLLGGSASYGRRATRNQNVECRNQNEERMTNVEIRMRKERPITRHSGFGHSFVIRISTFPIFFAQRPTILLRIIADRL